MGEPNGARSIKRVKMVLKAWLTGLSLFRSNFMGTAGDSGGFASASAKVLAVAMLTCFVGQAHGQTGAQDQTASGAQNAEEEKKDQIALNLQDVDIRVLINTVAEVSGKNFIVDPRVKGKVSVISGSPLDPDQLYGVFLSILEVHKFATVETGNIIKVLPSNVIKQSPTPTLFEPTDDDSDEQITQIIQLKHAPVNDLVAIVRPLLPPTSHFSPHQPSNSVVLTDTTANIQRVLKIIRKIDVPPKSIGIQLVNLKFAVASDLAATLTQLITSTAGGAATGGAAAPKVSIQAYDSTNSLLISAPEDEFDRIQALIDELDVEKEIAGDVTVIPLKHADAPDLAGILRDLNSAGAQGNAANELLVQADEASNSLVVKATGAQLKSVQSVVEKLDRRRAQVFVEAIIAEVSATKMADLGFDIRGGVQAPVTGGAPASDDGMTPAVAGAANPRANTVGRRAGTGTTTFDVLPDTFPAGGITYNLSGFGRYNLDVTLRALRADNNSNVLSTPTVLTLDNEEAEIIVGQEVPFITGQFNNGFNNNQTTDANGNQTVVGTGFQSIERRDVGLVLRITPQISEGDTIQMEVFQESSGIDMQSLGNASDLITNRSSIEATVQVDDGQVIALGGLIQDNSADGHSSIPLLGRLPLIGHLFRNADKSSLKRNLVVFLKPTIIRTPGELAKLSKVKYEDIRRDGIRFRNENDGILLGDVEPPVLIEYDKAAEGQGVVTQERYLEREAGEPKRPVKSRIKDIIFGRKPIDKRIKELEEKKELEDSSEFETDGVIEEVAPDDSESE